MTTSRRQFLFHATATGIALGLPLPRLIGAAESRAPNIAFPAAPRERIAIASYPFRDFVVGKQDSQSSTPKKDAMEIARFAAYTKEKFGVARIEPWSEHFLSLEPKYLADIRAGVEAAKGSIVNVAVDGPFSACAPEKDERDRAIAFSRQWIDAAVTLNSPSIRTNIRSAKGTKPDAALLADSLKQVAAHAEQKGVVVHLENDNPVSEDPFFLSGVIAQVNSAWLRALPDFGNSVATLPEADAYRGVDAMFSHAYAISHVKSEVVGAGDKIIQVDLARSFAVAKKHNYKGFFSMEWDSPGDPHAGTRKLIEATLQNLVKS